MVMQFQPPYGGAPHTPPPHYTPRHVPQGYYPTPVNRHRLIPCLYRFTYVWLHNDRSFWFYPIHVDHNFVYGYRWNGYTWIYRQINLHRILFFSCY
jgi:hypothetical protein